MKKTKQTGFRFSEKTNKSIEYLSRLNGFNATEVVENAIAEMINREQYNVHQNIAEFYQVVSKMIEPLQGIRDYDEEKFTPEMEEFLNLLNENWDKVRALKGFWESRFLEKDGEYLKDGKGNVIVDEEHEKTNPTLENPISRNPFKEGLPEKQVWKNLLENSKPIPKEELFIKLTELPNENPKTPPTANNQ